MILDPYYSLRRKFSVIGLTGRSASGCSKVADFLSGNEFVDQIKIDFEDSVEQEVLKQKICNRFIKHNHWTPYTTIRYRDVLILLLFHEGFYNQNNVDQGIDYLFELIENLGFSIDGGARRRMETERFNRESHHNCFVEIRELILQNEYLFLELQTLKLSDKKAVINSQDFNEFFFNKFIVFTEVLIDILSKENYFLRSLFLHDLATTLRSAGSFILQESPQSNIFIVVERLNWILKNHKNFSGQSENRYVIDSLKNSLELTYFKEKYSAFYMVSVNKSEQERLIDLELKLEKWVGGNTGKKVILNESIVKLDNTEYKSKDVNSGKFSSPDVENCIQKSDYHIFFSNQKIGRFDKLCINGDVEDKIEDFDYNFLNLHSQLLKLLSLIFNPGLVTPSFEERLMQVAFTAKLSSGCISRQVGAIVTDPNYSVKAIGWNDVAENQLPCNLRDFRDLRDGKNNNHFSQFELNNGELNSLNYSDNLSFKDKIIDKFSMVAELENDLSGKPCSFCFKSCHNHFEQRENQVHTRSLHAEENAMLQISKYGGQPLKGGFLFTTASPCELCAKKAFQLGLTKIFYIDPYPGISRFHTLKNGICEDANPSLIMYQGAIGGGYLRLYQPFMSYKDELGITTGVKF